MGRKMKNYGFCEEVKAFLKVKKPSTCRIYKIGLDKFRDYYRGKYGKDKTVADFLNAVSEDMKKPALEQKRIAETEFNGFIKHLENLSTEKTDLKTSANTIRLYLAAVQNLLKYWHITVSFRFVDLPKAVAKRVNHKHEWELEEVQEFFNKATNYRDKALTICIFQSGLGVAEICSLNYGDVKYELEKGMLPLCLKLNRKKTQVEFRSFLGADAVKYLKLYLKTRSSLTRDSPLFTKLGSKERMTECGIDATFRRIALTCDFIKQRYPDWVEYQLEKLKKDTKETEKNNHGKGIYNPARPHSLRAAFRSRLTGKVDPSLIESWMGHELSGNAQAYINKPTSEHRDLYGQFEFLLAIERTSQDELSKATPEGQKFSKLNEKVKTLEETITHLSQDLTSQKKLMEHFSKMVQIDEGFLREAYEKTLRKQQLERQQQTEEEQKILKQKT